MNNEDRETDISEDIIIYTSKKCKKDRSLKPTKFMAPKSKGTGGKKHISTKRKREEGNKEPIPKADPYLYKGNGLPVEGPGTTTKEVKLRSLFRISLGRKGIKSSSLKKH